MFLIASCAGAAAAQSGSLPLESVAIEGSSIPQPAIMEISGLRIASPIDKTVLDLASKRLLESGLFASVSYRYAPSRKPKTGYALTLTLADQAPLTAASIDVPGADENETWQWLVSKFHRFDHEVPGVDEAQRYLARQLEQHFAGRLHGQALAIRMEADLDRRTTVLSFQPEVLPRIQSIAFTGNQAAPTAELNSVMNRVAANEGYTDRRFASLVDLNLRPVYEQRGLYRVRFASGAPQWSDAGVSVGVTITEGAPYQLGKVELVGEDLPAEVTVTAAKLPTGKLANWKLIQECLWDMEKAAKRKGFLEVATSPARLFDDAGQILNLRIRIDKGPLYHLGEVQFRGLSPDLQTRARQLWKPRPGDPFDPVYPSEFIQALSRVVDLGRYRKYDVATKKGSGDYVVDVSVVFEAP